MSESVPHLAHDYLADVPYLRTFSHDPSPARLRLVTALSGFVPPPETDFDYLELGCGKGDTLTTLAAMYPDARFVGVDISAEHVAFASDLARLGGLTNVRFVEADFEKLGADELGRFDFICMYGVLSWVSPSARRAAIAFSASALEDGGLLFVSHNALPGWAAVEPLRRLMLEAAAGAAGSSLERARVGVSVAKVLADAGAEYFVQNPQARLMLDTLVETGLHYAVHEYFVADWHPLHFEDVAREMAAGGLRFAGQLPLFLNYRHLAIPASFWPLFQGVTDRHAAETLKDYVLNQFFRRDVYQKGGPPISPDVARSYLDDTIFGTTVLGGDVRRTLTLPSTTRDLSAPITDDVIAALSDCPTNVSALARSRSFGAYDVQHIRDAVLDLVIADQLIPFHDQAPSLAPAASEKYRLPLAYNRMILAQRLTPEHPVVLASPRAGRGLVLSQVEAVSLRALTEANREEISAWLRTFVAKQPLRLLVETREIATFEEQLIVLEKEVAIFREKRAPKLVQLGILAPEG